MWPPRNERGLAGGAIYLDTGTGSKFRVPGSRFVGVQVQGARFKVPRSLFKVQGSGFRAPSPESKILRLPAALPLDVAADAGSLHRVHGEAAQYRIRCRADIAPGYRNAVSRPAAVELSPIDQRTAAIEEKQIRRTRRAEFLRHLLGFVEQVRKRVACLARVACHAFGSVLGKRVDVIRRDAGD